MFINPSFSLKSVVVDGIQVILNSEEAKELRKKYPSARISALRKSRKVGHLSGPCVSIPVYQYLKGA